MYRRAVYPLMQHVDAERTHDLVLRLLAQVERTPPIRRLIGRLLSVNDPRLGVRAFGLDFANPIGIAAGLDKNAVAIRTWGALGFGHVEVGTVTPQPQAGNPKPRVYRLPPDRAVINRMGFPGHGMQTVQGRLRGRDHVRPVLGVNLGANKSSVESGRAADDYLLALATLYAHADYLSINISSPNTARLRDLQGKVALRALIAQLVARRDELGRSTGQIKPVLLKIAPDLAPHELDDVVEVCVEQRIDGLIATNTTLARPSSLQAPVRNEAGGLSGAPLRDRSNEVIRHVAQQTAGRLPIIGVGGVFSAVDVWAKLAAGASVVQVYTGFIYEGPTMARRINRDLIHLLDRHNLGSIEHVTGSDLRPRDPLV